MKELLTLLALAASIFIIFVLMDTLLATEYALTDKAEFSLRLKGVLIAILFIGGAMGAWITHTYENRPKKAGKNPERTSI